MKYLYLLRPRGALCIQGGIQDGLMPRSDTLSAALISLWPLVDHGADLGILVPCPPFRISSALPWLTNAMGKPELLLPLPMGWISQAKSGGFPEENKLLKKVKFAETTLLANIRSGRFSFDDVTVWERNFLVTSFRGSSRFARKSTITHVSIDRLSGGSREGILYDQDQWMFEPDCGWGLICEMNQETAGVFTAALGLLGMEGLGSDRSSGLGQFEIIEGPISWTEPDLGAGARMLISLCIPSESEVSQGILDGYYTIIERSGWITAVGARSLRRGRVRMMAEGSWYPDGPPMNPGAIAEVQEANPELGLKHPVFRDGRALTIAISAEVSNA